MVQSPKTINASGMSGGESGINMLTGLNGNIVENPNVRKDGNLKDGGTTKLFLKDGKKSTNKPKPKEKRRVRGKLSKEEEMEMKRTCKNVFDWLKPSSIIIQTGKENINIAYKHDLQLRPDLNNIQIIVNDKTAHTPELGPPSV